MNDYNKFLEAVGENVRRIPRLIWLLAFSISVPLVASKVAAWPSVELFGSSFKFLAAPTIFGWTLLSYMAVTAIIGCRRSTRGYVWYVGSVFVLLLPAAVSLGTVFKLSDQLSENSRIWIIVVGFLITIFNNTFLAAWPISQALQMRAVSPFLVFRATRGHRWGLAIMAMIASAAGKSVPGLETADEFGHAVLLGVGNVLVDLFGFAMVTCSTATAWIFAAANNPALKSESGEESRADLGPPAG